MNTSKERSGSCSHITNNNNNLQAKQPAIKA